MKFRTKIWMLPLAAAGVFIVGLSSAIVVGHSTQTTLAHLQNVDNPYLESMLRVGRDAEQLRMTLQSAASEGDPGKLDELKPLQADAVKALDTAAALEGKADSAQALRQACARRPNFDHPCRLNIDQGWKPVSNEAGCG
jgi:methyl-accepting chemotaxis protein